MRYQGPSITLLLGYQPEELVGQHVLEFIHPDDRDRASALLESVRCTPGLNPPFEVRFRHRDGGWRWFECTGTNLLGLPGFERVVFNAHDITDHRAALDALKRSEENFRTLIENVSDVITVLRPDGSFVYHSLSVTRVLGYDVEYLIGQNAFELIHPDDVGSVMAAFEAPAAAGTVMRQFRFRHRDGSWRLLEGVGRALYEDGVMSGAVITSRDITERRELEERLRQAQKLESIGLLAGGIAHDFNNMLTVINGYTDLVIEQLDPQSAMHVDMVEVSKAAGKAATLTYQLLAFSRKQILNARHVNLNDVVGDASRMLGRLIGEHITLQVALAPALSMAYADPNQIVQVLMNLAVNARDAMPDGGHLTIETANVMLDAAYAETHRSARPGPHVMLAVTDTGTGMDAATKRRIFEPFFTTKGVGKGTGMGLATVYGIVKQSGGNIWVYSEPGQGSVFKIYLPLAQGEARRPSETSTLPVPAGTERILLVEDEASVRRLARQILEGCGYAVTEASDGREALALSGAGVPFDALVTDLVMPNLGGRPLAQMLRQVHPGLKVVFMSGYTDATVPLGELDRLAAFVQKPFTAWALGHAVRDALDRG